VGPDVLDPARLTLFLTATIALLLVPGPSVIYVTTRSLEQGRRAGFASTLGLAAGDAVQVLAVVLGLSAIVASSTTAFDLVKYAGAAYLLYLGLRRLLTPEQAASSGPSPAAPRPVSQLFVQGLLVNALNPKTALFFLALFPTFVDVSRGLIWAQTLLLGAMFVGLGICTNGGWALLSGTLSDSLRSSEAFRHARRFVSGGVFLVLGLAAATSGGRRL